MKTVKTFRYNEIFVYDRSGEKLAGRVQDLLKEDHVIHTFYSYSTGSTRGDGSTAIFFAEDILNLPNRIWYFGGSWGPDLPMDFILVPIEYNGRQYDAWITVQKLNNCFNSAQLEELKQVWPKYFSDEPERKLGFFDEDMNMKFDLVQEGITTNFNSQEIIRIMEDENLNSDTKCRRLFDRGEDYLSHVQWLCFRKSEEWIQYLFDHNFVTPDFRSSWEENRNEAWNRLDEVVDTAEEINNPSGKRTLFLDNRQWPEEKPCTLEQSWDFYVVRGESRGSNKETRAEYWFTHIKSSVSYIEDQGITQEKPQKKLGFFDENLNEDINRDFTSDEQIANIMNDPDITLEEKCRRLFDRTPEHIYTYGMGSYYTEQELYDTARQNGVYEEFSDNITRLRHQCSNWKHEHTNRIGCTTVMCISNNTEPLTVQGSYDYYVNHRNTTRFYGEGTSYPPLQWWAYLKYCIEVFEEAVGYKHVGEKKLGFFDEDMNMKLDLLQEKITTNLNVQEITDIMEDEHLTGDQKSQKLFGRPEGYVVHLQYLVMSATGFCFDYLDDHNFISEKAIHDLGWPEIRNKLTHAADNCLSLARNTTIGVATVFYTIHDCLNLDGSWEYYAKDQDDNVRYDWWSYIKGCIDHIEEETEEFGILQHEQPKQLGFFTESLDNDWLRNNFGITFEQLQGLIERNWEDDWYDENTGRYIEQFCLTWRRGQYPNADDTGIVSPCYDNCGTDYFDSLEKMCGYYSEEFIKDWITKYLEWCEQHGLWSRPQKRLGFFDD